MFNNDSACQSSNSVLNPLCEENRSTGDNPYHSLAQIVRRIQDGDQSGAEDLYRVLQKGVRWLLARQLGPVDSEDTLHHVFIVVVTAIRNRTLRDPERVMGYVRTVAQATAATVINGRVKDRHADEALSLGTMADRRANPEQELALRRDIELMKRVLLELSSRDREILERFYLGEQSQEEICKIMNLTDTQFRLRKSRAKARFAELGKRETSRTNQTLLSRIQLTNSAA